MSIQMLAIYNVDTDNWLLEYMYKQGVILALGKFVMKISKQFKAPENICDKLSTLISIFILSRP